MTQTAPLSRTHKPAAHGAVRSAYLANIHSNAHKLGYDTKLDRRAYEAVLDFLIGLNSCYYASLEQLKLVDHAFAAKVNNRAVTDVKFGPLARAVAEPATDDEAKAVLA